MAKRRRGRVSGRPWTAVVGRARTHLAFVVLDRLHHRHRRGDGGDARVAWTATQRRAPQRPRRDAPSQRGNSRTARRFLLAGSQASSIVRLPAVIFCAPRRVGASFAVRARARTHARAPLRPRRHARRFSPRGSRRRDAGALPRPRDVNRARATESMWRFADSSTVRDHHRRRSLTVRSGPPLLLSTGVVSRATRVRVHRVHRRARDPLPVARAHPRPLRLARLRGVRRSSTVGEAASALEQMYAAPLRYLHWLIAGGTIGAFAAVQMAQRSKGPDKMRYMNLHKSLGVTVLALTAPRLLLRLTTKIPAPVPGSSVEQFAAAAGHAAMYGFSSSCQPPASSWGTRRKGPAVLRVHHPGAAERDGNSRAAPSNCTNSSDIITNSSCPCTSARSGSTRSRDKTSCDAWGRPVRMSDDGDIREQRRSERVYDSIRTSR